MLTGVRGMILVLAGLVAGFVHVLSGPDHLAAMAPYATERKARAWRTGVRWGLGHSAGVLGVGLLALMLRDALPVEAISAWGERCVGLVLIGIGVWGLRKAMAATRVDTDQHRHGQRPQVHGRAAFASRNGSRAGRQLPCAGNRAGTRSALRWRRGGLSDPVWRRQRRGDGIVFIVDRVDRGRPAASGVTTQSALLGLCSVLALSLGGFWLVSDFVGHTTRDLVALVMT